MALPLITLEAFSFTFTKTGMNADQYLNNDPFEIVQVPGPTQLSIKSGHVTVRVNKCDETKDVSFSDINNSDSLKIEAIWLDLDANGKKYELTKKNGSTDSYKITSFLNLTNAPGLSILSNGEINFTNAVSQKDSTLGKLDINELKEKLAKSCQAATSEKPSVKLSITFGEDVKVSRHLDYPVIPIEGSEELIKVAKLIKETRCQNVYKSQSSLKIFETTDINIGEQDVFTRVDRFTDYRCSTKKTKEIDAEIARSIGARLIFLIPGLAIESVVNIPYYFGLSRMDVDKYYEPVQLARELENFKLEDLNDPSKLTVLRRYAKGLQSLSPSEYVETHSPGYLQQESRNKK